MLYSLYNWCVHYLIEFVDNNFERVLQLIDVMMDTCGLQQDGTFEPTVGTAGSEHLTDSTCDKQTVNLHAIKPQTTN